MSDAVLRVERVTTREAFLELRDTWRGLLEEAGGGPPFLTHEWFRCCVLAYRDPELHVLVVRDGARAVGIAPLWRYRSRLRGLEVRRIGFIACPDTPFAEILVVPDRAEETLTAVLRDLCATNRPGWDLLTLGPWSAESPRLGAMRALVAAARLPHVLARVAVVPRVRIRGSWESYWQGRSPQFRKSRRGILNRMRRSGSARVVQVRRDESGEAFQAVLAISRRSWKESRGLAVTSRPATEEFFRRLTDAAGENGWLLLWLLEIDGVPVAMEYDLQHAGTVYALRADVDESHKERSPGAYLEYELMKRLFEEGYVEYNTGPGENPYKLRWADDASENVSLDVANRTWRGAAAHALEGVLAPAWRRLRAARSSRPGGEDG